MPGGGAGIRQHNNRILEGGELDKISKKGAHEKNSMKKRGEWMVTGMPLLELTDCLKCTQSFALILKLYTIKG